MATTTVTRNGQITLRKEIRDELGIREGTQLTINRKGDVIMIKKVDDNSWEELESFLPDNFDDELERDRELSAERSDERTP